MSESGYQFCITYTTILPRVADDDRQCTLQHNYSLKGRYKLDLQSKVSTFDPSRSVCGFALLNLSRGAGGHYQCMLQHSIRKIDKSTDQHYHNIHKIII